MPVPEFVALTKWSPVPGGPGPARTRFEDDPWSIETAIERKAQQGRERDESERDRRLEAAIDETRLRSFAIALGENPDDARARAISEGLSIRDAADALRNRIVGNALMSIRAKKDARRNAGPSKRARFTQRLRCREQGAMK